MGRIELDSKLLPNQPHDVGNKLDEDFPKPVKLGGRLRYWRRSAIKEYEKLLVRRALGKAR
jgi:hypothetical protein